MRAFAALLVFGFHLNIPYIAALTGQGRVGVSFFFVLSGLLLGLTWHPGVSAAAFYRRRAARIYPAYIVALIAGAVLSYTLQTGPRDPVGGVLSVVLLQAWVPDGGVYFAWNSVSWSLSVEAFFYLLFPFIAPLVLSLRPRRLYVLRGVCFGVVVMLGLAAALLLPHTYEQPNNFAAWVTYIFPVSRLAEFVIGISLVPLVRGNVIPVRKWQATALLGAAYLLAALNPTGLGLAAITLVPLCIFLVRFAQADAAGETSVLHHDWLVSLGTASYCFYLVHQLVIRLENAYVAPIGGVVHGLGMVAALLISVALAYALHFGIEKRMDRMLNGRTLPTILNEDLAQSAPARR
ncbi:acyltransferase family protein [Arthrobacter sp. NA-172]|uniref:acyltransferase family protein n=1 Tax=Arthrobacter sp. NA-172 TaxID=3367524 RepID=UPI003754F921